MFWGLGLYFLEKRTHCNGSEWVLKYTSNLNLNVCIIFSVESGGRHVVLWNKTETCKYHKEHIHPQPWVYIILVLLKRVGGKCERECHDIYAAHGDACVENRGKPRSELCRATVEKRPHGIARTTTMTRNCHDTKSSFFRLIFGANIREKSQNPIWCEARLVGKIFFVPVRKIRPLLQARLTKVSGRGLLTDAHLWCIVWDSRPNQPNWMQNAWCVSRKCQCRKPNRQVIA